VAALTIANPGTLGATGWTTTATQTQNGFAPSRPVPAAGAEVLNLFQHVRAAPGADLR
jgi:hypothetical protein